MNLRLIVFKGIDEYKHDPLYEVVIEPPSVEGHRSWFFLNEEYAIAYAKLLYRTNMLYESHIINLIENRPVHGLNHEDIRPMGWCIEEWKIIDGSWKELEPKLDKILPRWRNLEI